MIFWILGIFSVLAILWCFLIHMLNGMIIADSNLELWLGGLDDSEKQGLVRAASVGYLWGTVPLVATNIAWLFSVIWWRRERHANISSPNVRESPG